MDNIGMNLFERDDLEIVCGQCRLKTAAVFEDVLSGIPFRKPKIQNLFDLVSGGRRTADVLGGRRAADKITGAAGPSAEAVDEPWNFSEPRCLQDSNAPDVAQNPIVG